MGMIDHLIARVPLLLRYVVAALLLCGLILAMIYPRAEICLLYTSDAADE